MSNVIKIKHGQNVPPDNQDGILQPYELGIIEETGVGTTGTKYVKLIVGSDGYSLSSLGSGEQTTRYYKDLYVPLAASAHNAVQAGKANDKFFCRFQGDGDEGVTGGDFYLVPLQKTLNTGTSPAFELYSVNDAVSGNLIQGARIRKTGVVLINASVHMKDKDNDNIYDSGVYLYVDRNGNQTELCTSKALLKDAGALNTGMYIYEAQAGDIIFIKAKNSTGIYPGHQSTYLSMALFQV